MTDEEFDKTTWHKGMRCSMTIQGRALQPLKTIHGTIVGVHFNAHFLKVLWDGKDCVSRIDCKRITLE